MAPEFDGHIDCEPDDVRAARLRVAARVCAGCPVRERCAAVAAELDPRPTGVWGGADLTRPPGRRGDRPTSKERWS